MKQKEQDEQNRLDAAVAARRPDSRHALQHGKRAGRVQDRLMCRQDAQRKSRKVLVGSPFCHIPERGREKDEDAEKDHAQNGRVSEIITGYRIRMAEHPDPEKQKRKGERKIVQQVLFHRNLLMVERSVQILKRDAQKDRVMIGIAELEIVGLAGFDGQIPRHEETVDHIELKSRLV